MLVVDGELDHERVDGDGARVVGDDEGAALGRDVLDAADLDPEPVLGRGAAGAGRGCSRRSRRRSRSRRRRSRHRCGGGGRRAARRPDARRPPARCPRPAAARRIAASGGREELLESRRRQGTLTGWGEQRARPRGPASSRGPGAQEARWAPGRAAGGPGPARPPPASRAGLRAGDGWDLRRAGRRLRGRAPAPARGERRRWPAWATAFFWTPDVTTGPRPVRRPRRRLVRPRRRLAGPPGVVPRPAPVPAAAAGWAACSDPGADSNGVDPAPGPLAGGAGGAGGDRLARGARGGRPGRLPTAAARSCQPPWHAVAEGPGPATRQGDDGRRERCRRPQHRPDRGREVLEGLAGRVPGSKPNCSRITRRVESSPEGEEGDLVGGEVGEAEAPGQPADRTPDADIGTGRSGRRSRRRGLEDGDDAVAGDVDDAGALSGRALDAWPRWRPPRARTASGRRSRGAPG